jgi:hypothetical protein
MLACAALLAALGCAAPKKSAPPPAAAAKHFLQTGKSYSFALTGANKQLENCKVLEQRDNWVKVSIREGKGSTTAWVNLNHVVFIAADPGKD